MAREDFMKSEHILGRIDRLEDAPQVRIDSAIGRLSVPLTKVEYGEKGSVDLAGEKWKMHFEYEPTKIETVHVYSDGGEWRKLTTAHVETPWGSIDLLSLLPAGRSIYLRPHSHEIYGEARYNFGVLAWGDISQPLVLAILLHEIGHIVDIDQLSQSGILNLFKEIDEHEYSKEAAVLRRERVASAFALKMMRPFLSSEQRQDMILFLKHYALKSYYKSAKRAIAAKEATKAEVGHYAQQNYEEDMQWLEEQNAWDDFLEWKDSAEYTTWKAQNPSVEESDEFSEWSRMKREAKE